MTTSESSSGSTPNTSTSNGALSSEQPTVKRIAAPPAFPPATAGEREDMLSFVRHSALVYGPWRHWKKLYKQAESSLVEAGTNQAATDLELLGALAGRLDLAPLPSAKESGGSKRFPVVLSGSFSKITVAGNFAYLLEPGGNFRVIDITDPVQPRVVGAYRSTSEARYNNANQLVVEGSQVMLGGYGSGLTVVDVADPTKPKLVGNYTITHSQNFAIANGYAFLLGYEGINSVRLPQGNETAVEQVGQLQMYYPQFISTSSNLAYVTSYGYSGKSFHIVDISDPAHLRDLGQLEFRYPQSVVQAGDHAFVITNEKISAIDVSRSTNPRNVGSTSIRGARQLAIAGERLFVASMNYDRSYSNPQIEVQVLDISQPAKMRRMGALNIPMPNDMAVANDVLFLVSNDGLRVVDVNDPARLQPIGQKPSAKTFGYMKRRARRLLRVMAEAHPDRYIALATAALMEAGQGHDSLDLEKQWISTDLLFSGGGRLEQKRHGRGGYEVVQPRFHRYAREERSPAAWDAHLELAQQLWAHPHLPWETQEAAYKILRANGAEISEPSVEQWGRLASGNSPAMIAVATRRIAAHLERDVLSVDGAVVAAAVYGSSPARRRALLQQIERATEGEAQAGSAEAIAAWRARFATRLAEIIGTNSALNRGKKDTAATAGLTRRQRMAALLLAARFDLSHPDFSGNGLLPALPALLSAGEAPLREVGLNACRRMGVAVAPEALKLLESLPEALRDRAIAALREGMQGESFDVTIASNLVRSKTQWIREGAWELLAASATDATVFIELWIKLWTGLRFEYGSGGYGRYDQNLGRYIRNGHYVESAALASALNSNAGLDTLVRSGLSDKQLRLRNVLVEPYVSPAVFVGLSIVVSPDKVLELIAGAKQETWDGWREAWLRRATHDTSKLAEFWVAVQAALNAEKPVFDVAVLRQRVLQDAGMAATFLGASGKLSPDLLVQILAGVSDEVWRSWREPLLAGLRSDPAQLAAFWRAVRKTSVPLEEGPFAERVLQDAEIVATFGAVEDDVLDADNPAFAPLLVTWLQAREAQMTRDNPLLLKAATHSLPPVRDWGLARLQAQGLELPSALRLLESGLLPSIAVGKQFFEAEPSGGDNELDFALALCDSPRKEVRTYGREYVQSRLDTLLQNGILQRLSANPNPEVQAFLAEHLLQTPAPDVDSGEFDRAVLRARGKGRRAKEFVKQRLHKTAAPQSTASGTPAEANGAETNGEVSAVTPDGKALSADTQDVSTLLELARGRTPRDAEWAMQQLARRALQGETIEGVQLEGVASL